VGDKWVSFSPESSSKKEAEGLKEGEEKMKRYVLILVLCLPVPALAETLAIAGSSKELTCCPPTFVNLGSFDALLTVESDPGPYQLPWMDQPALFPKAIRITGLLSGTFRDEPILSFEGWLDGAFSQFDFRGGSFGWNTEHHYGWVLRDEPDHEVMGFSGPPYHTLGATYLAYYVPDPPGLVAEPTSISLLLGGTLLLSLFAAHRHR